MPRFLAHVYTLGSNNVDGGGAPAVAYGGAFVRRRRLWMNAAIIVFMVLF